MSKVELSIREVCGSQLTIKHILCNRNEPEKIYLNMTKSLNTLLEPNPDQNKKIINKKY